MILIPVTLVQFHYRSDRQHRWRIRTPTSKFPLGRHVQCNASSISLQPETTTALWVWKQKKQSRTRLWWVELPGGSTLKTLTCRKSSLWGLARSSGDKDQGRGGKQARTCVEKGLELISFSINTTYSFTKTNVNNWTMLHHWYIMPAEQS